MQSQPRKKHLVLNEQDRNILERWTRRAKTAQALALRARIVLACAGGDSDVAVAKRLNTTRETVGKWRRRFLERGLDGLHDEPRPGAPRTIGDDKIEEIMRISEQSDQ